MGTSKNQIYDMCCSEGYWINNAQFRLEKGF
jgi:hypothetical protein